MNFYNKINTYLLERFPTLWNTNFVWLIAIGIITHCVFFVFGYLHLDIEILKNYSISGEFFNHSFFSIYIIIGLISFIYFAFQYFSHNPFKNFYPINKFYFWKIFAQLFIVFLLFSTVFISFESGMKAKANNLVPKKELLSDIQKVNLAYPFLFNNIRNYIITERSYPEPFPVKEISNEIIGEDTVNNLHYYHNIDTKKPYVTLENHQYQFGTMKMLQIDSCNSKEVIDSIIDVNNVYGLQEYSLYNFSKMYINSCFDSDIFNYETIAPQVHKIYQNKDTVQIVNILNNLILVCKKYNIDYKLQPSKMANAIVSQNLNNQILIRTEFCNSLHTTKSNETEVAVAEEGVEAVAEPTYNKYDYIKNIKSNYSVDLEMISKIENNITNINNDLGYNQFFKSSFWAFIFFSFFASIILIGAKYIPIKELLIGVVVAGVFLAIYTLFLYFINSHKYNTNTEFYSLLIASFYTAIIASVFIYGLYKNAISKPILSKLFLTACVSILSFLPVVVLIIKEQTKYTIPQICSIDFQTVFRFEFTPWMFILLELIGVAAVFILLRKLQGKEK